MPDLPILTELRGDLDRAYRRREAKRRRLPRLALVPAFAVSAAAALVVFVFQGSGDQPPQALAAVAAEQPPAAAPGKFGYFAERRDDWSSEWWVAADGSGRLLQVQRIRGTERATNDPIMVVRPRDDPKAGRWKVTGHRDGAREWTRDTRFGPGEFDAVHQRVAPAAVRLDVTRLPADPDALLAHVRARLDAAAKDDDPETGFRWPYEPSQLLVVLEQYLAHPLATPAQRSAMLAVAAGVDGMEVTEGVADPDGRPATRLAYRRELRGGGWERTELFFDPGTAALLASRQSGEDGGAYAYDRTWAPLATVDSTRARP
jgi:hypothetical protein